MKKNVLKDTCVLLVVTIMVLSTVMVVAGNPILDELDQQAPDQDTVGVWLDEGEKFAQSFTPTLTILTRVELCLSVDEDRPTSDLLVSIRSSLTGIDLTSVYISPLILPIWQPGGVPLTECDFPDIPVSPGQKYYIIIHAGLDYDVSQTVHWWESTSTYTGGETWSYDDDLGWKQVGSRDFCFKTYGVDNWPMFQRDVHHSGHLPVNAPDTNNVKWTAETGLVYSSSPAVYGGKVYIGLVNKNVSCLDANTGEFIWNYTTGDIISSSPAVYNGYVYIGSNDHKVYCLDADTGAFKWAFPTNDEVWSSPCVVDGYVYIGSQDKNIYCLNAATGIKEWNQTLDDTIEHSCPAFYNGSIYITTIYGFIYRFDAITGDLIWSIDKNMFIYHSPTIYDGRVYVAGDDKSIWCFDADNGDEIYRSQIGNGAFFSSPAVHNGKVYAGCKGHGMYCMDAYTGNLIWEETTNYIQESSPAVADGKVYVGALNGKIYCLDANVKDIIWTYQTGGMIWASPAVSRGKVYIGSDKLYCFADKSTIIKAEGELIWPDVKPGSSKTGSFIVENIGDAESLLDWKIESYPGWGTWTFMPSSGNDLAPEDGPITVQVEVIAPNEPGEEFDGELRIVNTEDPTDFCIIDITLTTPRNRATQTPLLKFLEHYPILYQLLQRFFQL